MAVSLRQEIEKILHHSSCTKILCESYPMFDRDFGLTDCKECRTDRICSAIGKTAEGMDRFKLSPFPEDDAVKSRVRFVEKCQAYLKEQVR